MSFKNFSGQFYRFRGGLLRDIYRSGLKISIDCFSFLRRIKLPLKRKFSSSNRTNVSLASLKKWFSVESGLLPLKRLQRKNETRIFKQNMMFLFAWFMATVVFLPTPATPKSVDSNNGSNKAQNTLSPAEKKIIESAYKNVEDCAKIFEGDKPNKPIRPPADLSPPDQESAAQEFQDQITSFNTNMDIYRNKLKACQAYALEKGLGGDKSGCEEAKEKFSEAKKEADTTCSQLKSGNIGRCLAVMRSCEDCPEEGGKKCARLPSGAKCPQLAGDDLEDLKEEIEDGKSTKEDVESDIKDLRDQILEKKGELAEAKQSYDEDVNTLQSELQEAQEEMETAVKEKQTEIDDNLQKAISTVQGELSKSLKIQHTFTNELAKASRTRRETKQKLYEKCRHSAGARLAAYRKYRRRAIREGRYGNKGVRKLMGKVRVSFTKQDNAKHRSYYSGCLSESAPLFASVEEDYKTALRLIDQQRKQMLAHFKSLKAQIQQLNNQALQKKNQIIQDFAKNTSKALQKFDAGKAQRTKKYKGETQQLTMALMELERQLQEKNGQLDAVNSRQGFNSRLKESLKKKGVSGDSGQEESNVAEAQAALAAFRDTVEPVYNECCVPLVTLDDKSKKDDKMKEAWKEAKKNKDCNSFMSAFKSIYSGLKFEDYHDENRKRMRRKMDMKHGSR